MNDPFRINKPQHIKVGSIKSTLQIHAMKAGLREVEASENNKRTRKKVPLCNGFRRFADTMMLNSKMNPVLKDMLIDHDVGLEKNYYRPSLDDLLQEYLKAVDKLTINEENRLRRKVERLFWLANRSRQELYATILKSAPSNSKGTRITRIMCECHLSYTMISRDLKEFVKAGLLVFEPDISRY